MALHKIGTTALLQAVYTRLTSDALTLTYNIFNYVPPSTTSFPYVMIGGMLWGKSADWTSADIKGEDIVIHAHVWSSSHSDAEAGTMMNNIVQAITASDISITGYTTLKGIADFAQIMTDTTNPNQLLRHGVIRFRFHLA